MYRFLREAHAHVRSTGSKGGSKVLFWLARCAAYRGDLTEAVAFDAEAIASFRYQSKFFRALTHLTESWEATDVGDFVRSREEARQANALVRELGLPSWIATTDWQVGEACLELGDAEGARRVLEEAVDLFERRKQPGQIPEVRARLARSLVMLGDVARARENAERAREIVLPYDLESRYIAAVALGEVREAEGDTRAAEALLREAVEILEPSGLGNKLAAARVHYARFLIRQGRGRDGRTELERARAFYRDPLAHRHRERIDSLLRQAAAPTA